MRTMNDLSNKVALITGATSGIGEACAKRFVAAGATVILSGRNMERGEAIVQGLKGKNAEFVSLDIDDDLSIDKAFDFINRKYGKLDILFNNAGIYPITPMIEDMDRDFCNTVINTNTTGTMMVTRRFLNMLRRNKGTILNNASCAGLQNYTGGGHLRIQHQKLA